MEIVLIRHGQSEANRIDKEVYKFLCGRFDCDLTEYGEKQAVALRNNPLLQNADAIFCSPLKRTIQTAKLFSSQPIIIDDRIQERTMGEFDGKAVDEVKSNPIYSKYFSEPIYMNFRNSFIMKAPNGESYADVEARVSDFLKEILSQNYNKVIIVSHAVAIRCLLKVILNLSEAETINLRIKQCEPILVSCD